MSRGRCGIGRYRCAGARWGCGRGNAGWAGGVGQDEPILGALHDPLLAELCDDEPVVVGSVAADQRDPAVVYGCASEALDLLDGVVEIPVAGDASSANVAVAGPWSCTKLVGLL